MASTASARLVDTVAGRYEIGRRLGTEPGATAYLARDNSQDRLVTLKILRTDPRAFPDTRALAANLKAAGQLKHSQILVPLDVGEDRRALFYVQQYVDGEPLSARLRRQGALPAAEAVILLREIADALAYAHSRGMTHGAISSDTVLMSGRRAFVQDFGATLNVDSTGADPRITDIRGFGEVAYEMLAGRAPFASESGGDAMTPASVAGLEPLLSAQPGVAPALAHLVSRCLEAGPHTHWPTAEAIVTELDAIAQSLEMARTDEPANQYFLTPGNWLAVGLVLIAVATSAYLLARNPSSILVPRGGQITRVTSDAGLELDPQISPDGRMVAYAAGTLGETRIVVRPITGGRSTSLPAIPGAPAQRWPAWSPDGTRLLFQAGSAIWSAPARGGAPTRVTIHEGDRSVASPVWSPDGKQMAFSASDGIYLRPNGAGGERKLADTASAGWAHALQWSPDGTRLAYVSGARAFTFGEGATGPPETSTINVVNVASGDMTQVTTGQWLDVSPAWTPDGQALLFVSNRGGGRDVYRVRLEGAGGSAPERITNGLNAHTISLSHDGRQLAYSTYARRPDGPGEGDIWVMSLVAK